VTGLGLADRYAALQDEMNRLYNGAELRVRVDWLLPQLPEGRLALFSTSDQGAGLAAACAAAREDETHWQRIHLGYAPPAPVGMRLVIVEPVDSGAAWTQAVRRQYPHATILTAPAKARTEAPLAA
jgi:hypothetical protein